MRPVSIELRSGGFIASGLCKTAQLPDTLRTRPGITTSAIFLRGSIISYLESNILPDYQPLAIVTLNTCRVSIRLIF